MQRRNGSFHTRPGDVRAQGRVAREDVVLQPGRGGLVVADVNGDRLSHRVRLRDRQLGKLWSGFADFPDVGPELRPPSCGKDQCASNAS